MDANGLVTIVGAGMAIITATRVEDDNYLEATAMYTLTVGKATDTLTFAGTTDNTAVNVALNGSIKVDYAVNLSFTRTATSTNASRTITYKSDKDVIATVGASSGVVTIVGAGAAIITATHVEDANYKEATAMYALDVERGTDTLSFPQETITVAAVISDTLSAPQTATTMSGQGTITYTSSEENVVAVDANSGEITILDTGESIITATRAEDGNYNQATTSYTLTVITPTPIGTLEDLEKIRGSLDGNYALMANIDLSGIESWQPIGDEMDKFTGRFNGRDFKIIGLNSSGHQYAGLFGYVDGASIRNLEVMAGNVSASSSAGVLVGRASNASISNSRADVAGNVSASTYAGGLVGQTNNSTISNSYADVAGNVSSPSAGGLVGDASSNSLINNSYAIVAGEVSATSSSSTHAGGLVGRASSSPISNSYAIVASDVSSSSTSSSFSYAGGLVGQASSSPISNSYARVAGDVSAISTSNLTAYAGGLVGQANNGTISNSYARVAGEVSATSSASSAHAGGLVGNASSNSPINNSYAIVAGDVSATSSTSSARVGGLVGFANQSSVNNSYARVVGDVFASASTTPYVGGLVGRALTNSPISNSYADVAGDVSATSTSNSLDHAGGLAGFASQSSISNSYAIVSGEVSATSQAGGLVGRASNSTISQSYYSANRKASENPRSFSNEHGTAQTVEQLRALTDTITSWTAFYDASAGHALVTDGLSAIFDDATDRRVWYFGDDQQLPTLNPSPVDVTDVDLSLYRARQHFVATVSSATQIDLSWSSAGGDYTYYEVYRHTVDNSSGAEKIAGPLAVSDRTYMDTGLTAGTTYYYWLKACDMKDICSDFFAHTQIEIRPVTPVLADIEGPQIFTVGVEIPPITFTNTGNPATSCSDISTTLLPGLSLGVANGTCQITGAPTATSSNTHTIEATNDNGSNTATVNIVVNPQAPSLSDTSPVATVISGEFFMLIIESSGGGDLTQCLFLDSSTNSMKTTLDGLSISIASNGNACVISGTLSGEQMPSFTVHAQNVTGSDEVDIVFTITPATPTLADIEDTKIFTVGQEIPPITFINNGVAVAANGCEVSSDPTKPNNLLPEGLRVVVVDPDNDGQTTCQIEGIPMEVKTLEYIVDATNAAGTTTATVTIIVNPTAPMLADIENTQTITAGQEISPIIFVNSGGEVTGCDIDAELPLPPGLSVVVADKTCQIIGVPMTASFSNIYTIVAMNVTSTDEATVKIAVNATSIPPDLASIVETQIYAVRAIGGVAISPISFTNEGSAVVSCSLNPATLPRGLELVVSNNTCAITGVPTEATVETITYTITGRNTIGGGGIMGESMATVTIGVVAPSEFPDFVISDEMGLAPGNFYRVAYSEVGDFTDTVVSNDPMTHDKVRWLETSGTTMVNYQVAVGVGLLQVTQSADPMMVAPVDLGDYAGGYVVFDIMVPDYGNYTNMVVRSDSEGVEDAEQNLGQVGNGDWQTIFFPVANYISAGVDLAAVTTVFSIFPDEDTQQTTATLSFIIRNIHWTNTKPSLGSGPPALGDIEDPQTFTVGVEITPITFVNIGGGVTSCEIISDAGDSGGEPLAGLSVAVFSGTCQITGTPTTPSIDADYRIVGIGTHMDDRSPATVRIEVVGE